MKLVKTLLLTTAAVVAFNASAKSHFEGTFVGAQLGTSKAASKKADAFANAAGAALTAGSVKKSNKFGVNGGVLVGHRAAVAQDVILGVTLGVDLESTKATAAQTVTTNAIKTEVKRKYIVNLLGQAGYTVTKDVLVFVNAGVSFAQFKFSTSTANAGSSTKNKNKFGYAIGAGAAYAINETVSADLSYLYTGYNVKSSSTDTSKRVTTVTAPKAYHTVTVGVKVNI